MQLSFNAINKLCNIFDLFDPHQQFVHVIDFKLNYKTDALVENNPTQHVSGVSNKYHPKNPLRYTQRASHPTHFDRPHKQKKVG